MRLPCWIFSVATLGSAYREVDGTIQQFNPTSPPIERCALGIEKNLEIIFGLISEEQAWKGETTSAARLFMGTIERVTSSLDQFGKGGYAQLGEVLAGILRGISISQLNSTVSKGVSRRLEEIGESGVDVKSIDSILDQLSSTVANSAINIFSRPNPKVTLPTATLTFLSSKAMNAFLGLMITSSASVTPSIDLETGRLDTEVFGLKSRMHNLAAQSCQAIDYSWGRDVDWVWALCNIVDLVESLLACADIDFNPDHCKDPPGLPHCESPGMDTAKFIPMQFVDLLADGKQIPDDLTDKAELLWRDQGEGVPNFFLYRGLQAFMQFAQKDYFCGLDKPSVDQYIPGWNTVLEIGARQEGELHITNSGRDRIPMWAVLRSEEDKCKAVILARGTANTFEWRIDFTTILKPFPLSSEYKVHQGFLSMLAAGSPALDAYIQSELFSADCPCNNVEFVVSGHSLGGGMANLIGLHLAESYKVTCGAKVTVVAFAPPHAFDEAANARIRSLINVRNIMTTMDPIPYFPCHIGNSVTGFPRCPRGHLITLGDGSVTDLFGDHVGRMEIDFKYFDWVDDGVWTSDNILSVSLGVGGATVHTGLPAPLQIGAFHGCSYGCFFGQYCTTDPEYWCGDCPWTIMPKKSSFSFFGNGE